MHGLDGSMRLISSMNLTTTLMRRFCRMATSKLRVDPEALQRVEKDDWAT